jgi:molybdate transport system permease protein
MEQVIREESLPQVRARERVRCRRGDTARFCAVSTALLVLFIVIPLAAPVWRASVDPAFWPSMTKPVVLEALWVTLVTTAATLLVSLAMGTPLAYLLARRQFPGKWPIETITDVPLVLPPVTAGVALLMAFRRRGVLGPQLEVLWIELPFTMPAVVMAQAFVAGSFYIRGAKLGFASIAPEVEEAAALDGASLLKSFCHVTLPLALPGIASGILLCLARAVSEFGATLMFAGNFAGRTQTMSLAIMAALKSDLSAALALAVLLVVLAAIVLIMARLLVHHWIDYSPVSDGAGLVPRAGRAGLRETSTWMNSGNGPHRS